MGITPNLKLATISEQDNPKVKDFFQDLAGDVSTSNMQKIDEAVKKIQDVANAAIASSEKGKAGGVATLGSDKKVVKEQLPDLNYLPDTSTLEDIPDGATRKAVTQAEKDAWNEKSNFSGSYNDLADKPNLDFIPTSAKGIAGGVAELGPDGKVLRKQLPEIQTEMPCSIISDSTRNVKYSLKKIGKRAFFDFVGTLPASSSQPTNPSITVKLSDPSDKFDVNISGEFKWVFASLSTKRGTMPDPDGSGSGSQIYGIVRVNIYNNFINFSVFVPKVTPTDGLWDKTVTCSFDLDIPLS